MGTQKWNKSLHFLLTCLSGTPTKRKVGRGGGQSCSTPAHPPLFFCTLHFVINFAPICNGCPFVITVALIKLPQFVTAFALISNNAKLSQFVTKACPNL